MGDRHGDLQLAWSVGRAGRAREERLRPGRAARTTRRAGRGQPDSWPSTAGGRRAHPRPAETGVSARRRLGARSCAAFRGRRVLVLADLVADEFVYGRVERVSREAPVLILAHDSDRRAAWAAEPTRSTTSARWAAAAAARAARRGRARPAPARAPAREGHRARAVRPAAATATRRRSRRASSPAARTPPSSRSSASTATSRSPRAAARAASSCARLRAFRGRVDGVLVSDYGFGLLDPGARARGDGVRARAPRARSRWTRARSPAASAA